MNVVLSAVLVLGGCAGFFENGSVFLAPMLAKTLFMPPPELTVALLLMPLALFRNFYETLVMLASCCYGP